MTRKTRIVTLVFAAAIAATGLIAFAGDLNPPPGAVAPTHKTLTEVEPRIAINLTNTPGDADSQFKITQPGSYYLTGNITGVVGKHGIEISASGVMLDLNGFDLLGVAGSLDGVGATVGGTTNIAVVNGSVRNWGGDGVDLATSGAVNCRVAGLLASGNTGNGIGTTDGTVSTCSAYFNSGNGINTGNRGTVSNCLAVQNTGSGISAGTACTVSNCSAYLNGINGITTSISCTVTNCSAYLNGGIGISAGSGGTVTNCSATSNSGIGISVNNGGTVTSCSASSNTGSGISASTACTVSHCSAYANGVNGISGSSGCTVSNCAAYQNTANGISIGGGLGCTVADCTARLNTLDGIVCGSQSIILGNTCANNGFSTGDGAGIHATGTDNRIEDNTCTSADRGIDVDVAGNVIIKNTCSGNSANNWDVVAGNVILVVNATTAAAVTGNSGGAAPGSTDPSANFTY